MRLYLVQHAEAKGEEEDPQRSLTEGGRRDVSRVSRFIAENAEVRVGRILHSGKTRARQTAEVFAKRLRLAVEVQQQDGLAPLDDPKVIAGKLADLSEDVMIVGHLPHLSKLASFLLCGDEGKRAVEFRMGGVVSLARDDSGVWSVEWMLTPDIVPG